MRATQINMQWLQTTEISIGTELHGKTALRALQDLAAIRLVRGRIAEDGQGKPYECQLSEQALKTIGGSEVFSDLEWGNV